MNAMLVIAAGFGWCAVSITCTEAVLELPARPARVGAAIVGFIAAASTAFVLHLAR